MHPIRITGGQVLVVTSVVKDGDITNMCQSVDLGGIQLLLTAGGEGTPVHVENLAIDSDVIKGDAEFHGIEIGGDASTFNKGGVKGPEGVYGQQADTVLIKHLYQHNYAATAGIFKLPDLPRRIEGVDIAHLQGGETVASLVQFIDGLPFKHGYKRFKIRSESSRHAPRAARDSATDSSHSARGGDDFAAIREVVSRRLRRLNREGTGFPDILLIDGGCSVEGYTSDISRTFVLGKPTDKMKQVFDIEYRAQTAALAAARPGVPCEAVDAAARKVIVDAGYGPDYKYFTHRVGHGMGMDGHEWPYLVKGNTLPLQPGMTFSDEPGIYIRGEFGVPRGVLRKGRTFAPPDPLREFVRQLTQQVGRRAGLAHVELTPDKKSPGNAARISLRRRSARM